MLAVPSTVPSESTPTLYRISRALTLFVCVPAALVLTIGVLVPVGTDVPAVIEQMEARNVTTGRGYRGVSYLLHTDQGRVEVPENLFRVAQEGDSLLIQRGPYKFGVRDFDQNVRLVRNGQVVREERPSDFFVGAMVLYVLFPLLSFRPYEKWKHARQMKVLFVMIPLSVIIVFLATL